MSKYKTLLEEDFNQISHKKEDLFYDRKGAKIEPKDLQNTIVAFANWEGGSIYIGISNDGNCDGPSDLSKYDSIIKDGILGVNPLIVDLKYDFLEYGGKFIILVTIPKSEKIHATSRSEVYIRVGASNKKLNQDEIAALKYKKGELKYEEETKNIDIAAITKSDYLRSYIKRMKLRCRPKDYLVTNGYVFGNKPKISSIICFHDKPQNILKCGVKVNIYEMSKTSRKYIYQRARKKSDKSFYGPLEILINNTLEFVFDSLSEMKIKYPEEAIIEGIVNALIHRDYSLGEDVIINIFDNKIEIINPGGFPGKIRVSDLNTRKISRFLRNPVINNVLFSISAAAKDFHKRLNQDQGEGIRTIFNTMKKAGLSDPIFKEEDNKVYLYLKHENAQSYENKILAYLENNDSIANRDARELLGEEDKEKIKSVFSKLEKHKKIQRIDPNASKGKVRYVKFKSEVSVKNAKPYQDKLL